MTIISTAALFTIQFSNAFYKNSTIELDSSINQVKLKINNLTQFLT
jgi:hypothetical protein